MSVLRHIWPFGRGAGVTVPPMDGALRPNNLLEQAGLRLGIAAPDNLVWHAGAVHFSSGPRLMKLQGDTATGVQQFPSPISALASAENQLAIALDDGTLILPDDLGLTAPGPVFVTAMCFDGPTLYFATGSELHPPSAWKRDLMEHNATGGIWRLDPGEKVPTRIVGSLGWVGGLCLAGDNLLFSESWAHRLSTIPKAGGPPMPVLDDLPGYPSRLVAERDGYWLCVFAPRGQLTEFVLKEDRFRKAMMAQIDPDHWASPALHSGRDFLEPLHLGGIRVMGQIKPWAPSRSYGLLVRLGADFQPMASAHSRTDGTRHGVTSVLACDDTLLVAAQGGDAILTLDADLSTGSNP